MKKKEKKFLTYKEKTNYLRIGLGIVGIPVRNETAEMIWRVYEGIISKGGEFTIDDAVNVQMAVERRQYDIEVRARKKAEAKKSG